MKCYQDLQTPEGELAAALGSFDGLHLGHRQVIGNTLSAPGLRPAVITFQQNPLVSLQKKSVPLLTTNEQKLALLEEMGVEVVYLLPFEQIRNMEPEDFVEALYRVCRVRALSCGFNFRFGKNGPGRCWFAERALPGKGNRTFRNAAGFRCRRNGQLHPDSRLSGTGRRAAGRTAAGPSLWL